MRKGSRRATLCYKACVCLKALLGIFKCSLIFRLAVEVVADVVCLSNVVTVVVVGFCKCGLHFTRVAVILKSRGQI